MAKAADVELDPFEPFADAARRIVAVRAEEMFEAEAGVLDTGDIERVHAMRVASRRLRAVLEIFAACFPKGEHRLVLREVKALADALGARRDPDVQLEALTRLEETLDERDRVGIEALAERVRAEQATGNEVLIAALERMRAVDLRGRLQELTRA